MRYTPTGNVSVDKISLQENGSTLSKQVLSYREVHKVLKTYLNPLEENLKDGRIYTQFNQGIVITGRLSSSNPINLQNIPSRGIRGKEIRSLFISETGRLLVADFNQIELRLVAHFSKDANMISAYKNNKDIHAQTAQYIFKTDLPTKEQRFIAKTINFSLTYGAGSGRLVDVVNSSDMGIKITQKDADNFISLFYSFYPSIRSWKNIELAKARLNKYIITLMGRKIPVENIINADLQKRFQAERQSLNYIIQGSAAEIMKLYLIELYKNIPRIKIVSCVHDEVLIEYDNSFKESKLKLLLKNIPKLNVPLDISSKICYNWSEK